ncbi:MAG: hypothetical protein QXQ70_07355 [Candidatus Caldarchaeum sp.]
MTTRGAKIPVPLKVEDTASLARLVASRADYIPPLLEFSLNGRHILSHLMSIPFGKYSLPLLVYTDLDRPPKPYLVYTPLDREETLFSDIPETGRYVSFPVIEIEPTPDILEMALSEPVNRKIRGLKSVHVKTIASLMRLVSAMVDEASSPPLWCFRLKGRHAVGIIYPVYEYYDSAALPLVYYTELGSKPPAPFIAYKPDVGGQTIQYLNSLSDSRFVYGRIIFVETFPFSL